MQPISIVLCTFNGAKYLDAQLESLREQEGVAEIVAVDDGSTDDTLAVLQNHARQDARIRIHRNPAPLGVTRNFERAISLAGSPWIALSDQDDVWVKEKLARLRAAWDGSSGAMHHATRKFRGPVPKTLPSPAREGRKFSGTDLRRLLYRNTIVGHTTLVHAEVVRRLMPFPPDVPHDWWIGVGAAAWGGVQYVDQYLVHYRIHERNAYHSAGSRFHRLRTEHQLRVQLLRALVALPDLPEPGRKFARDYLDLLLAPAARRFSWSLWRFYLQHAPLFFGAASARLPWFTRYRKSFSATAGAVGQRPLEPGHRAKAPPPLWSGRSNQPPSR